MGDLDLSRLRDPDVRGAASDEALQALERALGALPKALKALLLQCDGLSDQSGLLVYGSEALAERNETWEVETYAPGYLAIGDDSGGRLALVSRADDACAVWTSDVGDLGPEGFVRVADSLAEWFSRGCPFDEAARSMAHKDLDKGADLQLRESLVPDALMYLFPYVKRWAFERNREQDSFVSRMFAERPEEVDEFNDVVDAAQDEVLAWGRSLDGITNRHIDDLTEEDWAHPYWAFIRVLKVRELTGRGVPTEGEFEAGLRIERELRLGAFREASTRAEQRFRDRDYRGYVELLEGFSELLSKSQAAKLALARRRSSSR